MKFDQTAELTRKGLDAGLNAIDILNQALLPALDEVGTLFREGEYFLPDVLMSVKAYNDSYEILQSLLAEGNYKAKGTVMMGTVEGDIHEIGKNILLALLQGNGFQGDRPGSPGAAAKISWKKHKRKIRTLSACLPC